jgi:hypothetical protein
MAHIHTGLLTVLRCCHVAFMVNGDIILAPVMFDDLTMCGLCVEVDPLTAKRFQVDEPGSLAGCDGWSFEVQTLDGHGFLSGSVVRLVCLLK